MVKQEEYPYAEQSLKKLVYSYEDITKFDPVSLAALIRQRAHWVEDWASRFDFTPSGTQSAKRLATYWNATMQVLPLALRVWEERSYDMNRPYIIYAIDTLRRAKEFERTKVYHESPPPKPLEMKVIEVVEKVIRERRSIRRFTDVDVSDEIIDRILNAALWAPCACSIQGFRFIVLRKAKLKNLITQQWKCPVIIVVGVDDRPYQFIQRRGRYFPNLELDIGAAIQNMLLEAHAIGLGACWSTFMGEVDKLTRALQLPDYARLVTYVALGWPADNPKFVPRIELSECVSRDCWLFEEEPAKD